jgi:hypothetical protein
MQQTTTKPVTATATGTIALEDKVLSMTYLLLCHLCRNRHRAKDKFRLFALSPCTVTFTISFTNSQQLAAGHLFFPL